MLTTGFAHLCASADLSDTDPNALDIDSLHVVLTTKQRILLYIVAGLYSAAFFICGIGYVSLSTVIVIAADDLMISTVLLASSSAHADLSSHTWHLS